MLICKKHSVSFTNFFTYQAMPNGETQPSNGPRITRVVGLALSLRRVIIYAGLEPLLCHGIAGRFHALGCDSFTRVIFWAN
jgi:hypothetical protein